MSKQVGDPLGSGAIDPQWTLRRRWLRLAHNDAELLAELRAFVAENPEAPLSGPGWAENPLWFKGNHPRGT